MGEIAFLDRSGGGTHVRISLDADKLAALAGTEAAADRIPTNTTVMKVMPDGA